MYPISIRKLLPLHHSILHCAQYTISIQVLRILQASELHFAQCAHQHPNIALTAAINTLLCAMYPSVSKYCAHCNPQYYSVRTVLISMQIVNKLHTSELQCAKYTHKKPNIANTAPLNTPLCTVYLSAFKYCAHCNPEYSTVRNVPISIPILRPLHRPGYVSCYTQLQQLPTYGFTRDKTLNMIIQKTGH